MQTQRSSIAAGWTRFRSAFVRLATGGDWANHQTPETRRNLIWFWFDGFFASASDNINATYLVIYILALGATQAQIGLMSALSSLMAALLLLPGAALVERLGTRRGIVIVGGGWSRAALLLIAALPLLLEGPVLVYAAIALAVSRDAMGNLCFPAWMSLTADVVPLEGRGRYFASRNFIMGIAGMVTVYLAGLLISSTAQPAGYQIALTISALAGLMAVFSFGHIKDNLRIPGPLPTPGPVRQAPIRSFFRDLLSDREFAHFAGITALWNFSLNIAGPFFTIYLVQDLQATATIVGLTTIATAVASLLAQRKLGEVHDRWGSRKLTVIAGLLIPSLPLMWVFITAPWQVIPANLAGGALWAAYNLGSFNYLLKVTPTDRRARYSAIFQVIVTVSLAAGAALGSLVITLWSYNAVFISSAAGRLIAALLFAWIVARQARAERALLDQPAEG